MARTKDQSFVNAYLNRYQQNQKNAVYSVQQAASNAASGGVQQMNITGNIDLPSLYDPSDDLYGYVLDQQKAQIKAQQASVKAAQKAEKQAAEEAAQNMRDKAKMFREKRKTVAKVAENMATSDTPVLTSSEKKTGIPKNVLPGLTEATKYVAPYDSMGRPNFIGDGEFMPVLLRADENTMNYTGVPARSISKTASVQEWKSPYAGMTTKEKIAMRDMLEDAAARGTESEKAKAQKDLAQLEQDLSSDEGYLKLVQKSLDDEPEQSRIDRYLDPSYQLNKLEEEDAREIIKRYREEAADTVKWNSKATDEQRREAFDKEMTAYDLEMKISDLYALESNFAFAVPGVEAVTDAVVRMHKGDEYDADKDSVQAFLDPIRKQSPIASTAGSVGGTLASYAAGSQLVGAIPGVGAGLQSAGQAIGGTRAAQFASKAPVLGKAFTPEAITGILGDQLVDTVLDTGAGAVSSVMQGDKSGAEIAADAAKNFGTNLALNIGSAAVLGTAGDLLKRRAAGRMEVPSLDGNEVKNGAVAAGNTNVPSLDDGVEAAVRAAQDGVDDVAKAAYNGANNGGVYNGSQAVDDARRAAASNPANGTGSSANGWQSQFGGANGAGFDFRPGEAGAFAPGDIPPERVTNPDLETAFDLTSAERAAAANSGKDLRSSTTRNIKALYDDFDSGRISSEDFSARAREIARTMVNEDDFTFTNMDDTLREVRSVAKGQKLYVGDTELNELLSASGAKSLSDFNRRFGTQLTRDRQYIALDQIDSDLYWRYAGGTDTNPAEAFWSVIDGIKGSGAKSFDQAGYDEAVDYYRDLIERFDRYQREPGSASAEYAAYADDIPSLYQPYGANADLSLNDLPESMLNDTLPSLYDDLPESIGAKKAAFGYTEVPSQANTVQSIDERFLRPEDIAAQGGQRQYTHQRISMAQQAEAARQIRQTEADDEIIQRIANKENGGGNVSWEDVSTLGAITRDMDRQLSMLDPKSQEYSDLMAKKLYASDVLQSGVSETVPTGAGFWIAASAAVRFPSA